jgi:hypothetical protein
MGSSRREHLMVDQLLRVRLVPPGDRMDRKASTFRKSMGSPFRFGPHPYPQKIGARQRAWGALHRQEPKSKRSPALPGCSWKEGPLRLASNHP